MYRAYYAIPRGMKTNDGLQTNAIFGVASMLMQILKTEQPDSLLFCFDAEEKTFRHVEYEAYKAGRAETPDDFFTQIPHIFRMIDTFGFKRAELGGFEADDLLCAYAKEGVKNGNRVTIITGDRDAFQLVDENVRVAIPAKGYQMPEYLSAEKIKEKYGVTPDQIASYKGLVGDSSDNLKGVNGIGPVAAASLLQKYGTLKNLYDHIDEVKPAWREKLINDKEAAFFCERMAQLVCDFALPISFEELAIKDMDAAPALTLFREFEFNLLTKRLQAFLTTEYAAAHFVPLAAGLMTEKIIEKKTTTPSSESTQLSLL